MNMALRGYTRGERVGTVDRSVMFGPALVPASPAFWYVLEVHSGCELKVVKAFRRRNISVWLPLMKHTANVTRYHRGYETTVEQQVTSPMITGAVLIPDFELEIGRWPAVEGVIGVMSIGDCVAELLPHEVQQLRWIEAVGNTPKSKRDRKFALGELVRVTTGPFAMFAGCVERFDSPGRLSVGLSLFGRSTRIVIDESALEPVPATRVAARPRRKRRGFRRTPSRVTESR